MDVFIDLVKQPERLQRTKDKNVKFFDVSFFGRVCIVSRVGVHLDLNLTDFNFRGYYLNEFSSSYFRKEDRAYFYQR